MVSTMNQVDVGDELRIKDLDLDTFKLLQARRCGWQDGMEVVNTGFLMLIILIGMHFVSFSV